MASPEKEVMRTVGLTLRRTDASCCRVNYIITKVLWFFFSKKNDFFFALFS